MRSNFSTAVKLRHIAASIVLAFGLNACSTLGEDHFNSRFYGGVSALVSELEPNAVEGSGVAVDEGQSSGGSVQIGYDLMSRLSIESHYSSLGEASFTPSGSIGYEVAGISALGYLLGGERKLRRREAFALFVRLGAGFLQNEAEDIPFERINDFHLLAGIGAEYGFSNGLGVRLEATSHDEDVLYGQIGLVYRLGAARSATTQIKAPSAVESVVIKSTAAEATATSPLLNAPIAKAKPLDSDRDGISDMKDECVNTESRVPVDDKGCDYFNGVVEGIQFDAGSDALTIETRSVLGRMVDVLIRHPKVRISIAAHTDNRGPARDNLMMTRYRVVAIMRFLVDRGIDGSRLRPQAFGEGRPLYSNATAAGRARNQRVEMKVLEQ